MLYSGNHINRVFSVFFFAFFQELRYKRHAEFKDNQLQQALERINSQDEQISKLEEELLQSYQKPELLLHVIDNADKAFEEKIKTDNVNKEDDDPTATRNVNERKEDIATVETEKGLKLKMFKSEEVQTSIDLIDAKDSTFSTDLIITQLKDDLVKTRANLDTKETTIDELKTKIIELELNLKMFKTQIADKQSQIMFYEKHIVELKRENNKTLDNNSVASRNNNNHAVEKDEGDINNRNHINEEIVNLKV